MAQEGREATKCCDTVGSVTEITLIQGSDIKSLEPFKMKRKYGKFNRKVKQIVYGSRG